MVELELSKQEVELLLAALKVAESSYTDRGNFKACQRVSKLHSLVWKQTFTYGQV
jgi:hypothetical protein